MENWIDEINNLQITQLAPSLSLKMGRMQSFGPCPSCGAERRGSSDPRGPLGLTPNKLGFMCHRCKVTGDQLDLVSLHIGGGRFKELGSTQKDAVREFFGRLGYIRRSGGAVRTTHISGTHRALQNNTPTPQPKREYKGIFSWAQDKPMTYKAQLTSKEGAPVFDYLVNERKLTPEVLDRADIGCLWSDKGGEREYWISIPLKDEKGQIVNMRFRSVPPAKKQYRVCPARPLPLFGASDLDKSHDTVIVTEGEFDVLSMWVYGFKNVVSGTAGATANWKEDWLDALEKYKSFILLYDDDQAGNEGAEKLADKLGKYRCFRSLIDGFNDPNEALIAGLTSDEINAQINEFESFVDPKLARVDDFQAELEQIIMNPHQNRGDSTGSNLLDNCMGGIRQGELWIVTGDSGAGKSTFANWLCYEQAVRDTPVMMTSFENRPIGTVQKLLRNHLGGDYTKSSKQERAQALKDLGNMPIYLMDHYGELGAEQVIEAVRFSARRHGVKIALIDHLGFLTTPKENEDERLLIERTVRELALIAVQDKITIYLICHPNNTSVYQNRRVKYTDLKGASAIRQDAHGCIVVERADGADTPTTNLYFDKVRSEFGRAGSMCAMAFDPLSCIYADTWDLTPSGQKGKNPIQPSQGAK